MIHPESSKIFSLFQCPTVYIVNVGQGGLSSKSHRTIWEMKMWNCLPEVFPSPYDMGQGSQMLTAHRQLLWCSRSPWATMTTSINWLVCPFASYFTFLKWNILNLVLRSECKLVIIQSYYRVCVTILIYIDLKYT